METRFLVTEEGGRLARWLRLLGYDTVWAKGFSLSNVYCQAYNERRIVVTRNRKIRASGLFQVRHLKSERVEEQLQQLMREVKLAVDHKWLFTRCDVCNVPVEPIDTSRVTDRVPPHGAHTQSRFFTCPACQRVYWAATHWHRVRAFLDRVITSHGRGGNADA